MFDYSEQQFNLADAASLFMSGLNGFGGMGRFSQSISSSMYSFDLTTFEWRKLPKSAHSCYAHSLVTATPVKLVFYGGLCDSNRFSYASTVYVSNQIRVYDTSRQEWINTFAEATSDSSPHFSIKLARRQRYAHASFIFDRSLFIYAGFNGFFLSDLFRIDLDRLGLLSTSPPPFPPASASVDAGRIRRSTWLNSDINRPYLDLFLNRSFNNL